MEKDKMREMVREMIVKSLIQLVLNDSEIFIENNNINDAIGVEYSLDRKLHEITINHRFAVYLEQYLIKKKIKKYSVDIEYNRNFLNPKELNIGNKKIIVRPDILIHKRQDKTKENNLLIVEAKKGDSSEFDRKKIIAFMNDGNYKYQFGLAVSYCSDRDRIACTFFYKENKSIHETEILIEK